MLRKFLIVLPLLSLAACSGEPSMAGLDTMSCSDLRAKMQEVKNYKNNIQTGGSAMDILGQLGSTTASSDTAGTGRDMLTQRAENMQDQVQDAMDDAGCKRSSHKHPSDN